MTTASLQVLLSIYGCLQGCRETIVSVLLHEELRLCLMPGNSFFGIRDLRADLPARGAKLATH